MCGRYGYTNPDNERIKKKYSLKKITAKMTPRYNISPGQNVPVILNESSDELSMVRWGLIPFWAKEENIGYKMINARSETIFEKPSFRNSIKKKRCLILADQFYEWKKTEDGKQPFKITPHSGKEFAFLGIWDSCTKINDEPILSCSIITRSATKSIKDVHDRMPVILDDPKIARTWLDEKLQPEDIKEFFDERCIQKFTFEEISKSINSPSNEYPNLDLTV